MHVEECCQSLLAYILPLVDKKRNGICIDVGVGTFAFYCEMFSRLGFQTVAVEPLPGDALRRVCCRYGVTLVECCLSGVNGIQTLYIGNYHGADNLNLCSLLPNWWGASSKTQQVQSMTLSTLLSAINAKALTCLKLDVEGMEFTIIRQFLTLPELLLPSVVMFEYGGGDNKESGRAAWSPRFLAATMESLRVLQKCGYGFSVVIEAAPGTTEHIVELPPYELEPEQVFHPYAIYGNIISLKGSFYEKKEVERICTAYRDNDVPPPALNLPHNYLRRLFRRFYTALVR